MMTLNFMTLPFVTSSIDEVVKMVLARAQIPRYGFMVTPNVDHLNKLLSGQVDREIYTCAEISVNDSRILELLAKFVGKSLPALPGSDIVLRLLEHEDSKQLNIAITGPIAEDFQALAALYPAHNLIFIPSAQRLVRDHEEWLNLLQTIKETDFDILLCCISFPKQEYLAYDLIQTGLGHGFAICAGASIDFLTGKQKRAPKAFQKMRMEWLFRLASDPKRLFGRYLIDGPAIFLHFLKTEVN